MKQVARSLLNVRKEASMRKLPFDVGIMQPSYKQGAL